AGANTSIILGHFQKRLTPKFIILQRCNIYNFSVNLDKLLLTNLQLSCILISVTITIIERKEESDGHIEIQPPERIY
ncbi:hypothetical protein LI132_15335, partial [Blautia faecis]